MKPIRDWSINQFIGLLLGLDVTLLVFYTIALLLIPPVDRSLALSGLVVVVLGFHGLAVYERLRKPR